MALLDLLRQQPNIKLIVAHYDHGIRGDSQLDRQLVQQVAQQHKLPFIYDEGKLGPGASEAVARKARYDFLRSVRQVTGARAIITAHHQDDLLETVLLNLLRGTARRGITSLQSHPDIHRPLLHVTKQELLAHAEGQGLEWREDSTNQDIRYLRNFIRHKLVTQLTAEQRQELLLIVNRLRYTNQAIEEQLVHYLHLQPSIQTLGRKQFIVLPHAVAREVMAAWLRNNGLRDYDRKTLERLVAAAKTWHAGRQADINRDYRLGIGQHKLALIRSDR